MGILDRAIRNGVNRAVGNTVENAVGNAIEKTVAPKVNQAVNRTAQDINQAASRQQQTVQPQNTANQAEINQAANTLGGLFGGLTSAATNFANEAAKNMKICPSCGEGADKDVKFCPKCGAKLPEETVAQGAVCPSCGKQNNIGTKFCADCGAKLPSAIAEEQAAQAKDAAVMEKWDENLSAYPKWSCGGTDFNIETEDGYFSFSAVFPNSFAAQNAVQQYRELLQQNGFRQAGQYPDTCHLYKMAGNSCYHADTEHCFEGNSDSPVLYFNIAEPTGGFNYTKPEQKKNGGFFDLFK